MCDGKVGEYFGIISIAVNQMMAECLYPEENDVSLLWSQDVAKRVGGADKARDMFEITSKLAELHRTGRSQFASVLEREAVTAPTRSLAARSLQR